MIKAKMHCHYVQKSEGVETLHAHPVYSGSEENKSFSQATPSGNLSLTITNPEAFGVIKEGQDFYLNFTPIDMKTKEG